MESCGSCVHHSHRSIGTLVADTQRCKQRRHTCAQLPPDQGALAWVQYMRWARRADGLAASRKLFIRSRKWPACGWQARPAPAARAATYQAPARMLALLPAALVLQLWCSAPASPFFTLSGLLGPS